MTLTLIPGLPSKPEAPCGYGGMSDMDKAGLVQMNMLLDRLVAGQQLHHNNHAGNAHTTFDPRYGSHTLPGLKDRT